MNKEDVLEGFRLYNGVSAANEMGLPPEMYEIYIHLEPEIPEDGVTRKQFQTLYYQTFHRTIRKKRLGEVLGILESVGLLTEEPDPTDRRQKRVLVTGRGVFSFEPQKRLESTKKINTPQGVTTPPSELKKRVQGRGCYDCTHFTENLVHKHLGIIADCKAKDNMGLTEPTIHRTLKEGCNEFDLDRNHLRREVRVARL